MAAVIILSVISLIFIVLFIAQRRQIRKIRRRLEFVKDNKSNLKISFDTPFKSINELTEQLNQVIDKAHRTQMLCEKRENELKSTVTNLSHDIRTPLTSLDGYFQLLSQCESDDERARYSEIIKMRISSLKDILEELFTYTKLQNEDYELPVGNLNITQTVCEAAFSFYDDFKLKGIEPDIDITDNSIIVKGNEDGLRRIFGNIIKNALEHGSGAVALSIAESDGAAVFTCSNETADGGIDVDRVFERFYKSDSARTQTSTGLGLSIAKELAQRMGGTVRAELKGEIFKVIFEIPIKS